MIPADTPAPTQRPKRAPPKRRKPHRSPGSRRIKLDLDLIRSLARLHCTLVEIAAVIGCSAHLLEDRPEVGRIVDAGKEEGRASLRRMQWRSAEEGSVAMQIFLGKQILGQADKLDHTGSAPVQVVIRSFAAPEPKGAGDAQRT